VEVFGNYGEVALSVAHVAPEKESAVTAAGDGSLSMVAAWTLKSVWK
jgi:hypothetical protein